MKNPFKKSSITDTLVNVGAGGAANVAFDYLYNLAGLSLGDTTKNIVKVAIGAFGGSMVSNKIARAAADGIAVVGVSTLISDNLIGTGDDSPAADAAANNGGTGGVAFMGRTGQQGFRKVYGKKVGVVPFMG